MPGSELSEATAEVLFAFGSLDPRIHLGNLNSSCAKKLAI
jgi:hypothetical protein